MKRSILDFCEALPTAIGTLTEPHSLWKLLMSKYQFER